MTAFTNLSVEVAQDFVNVPTNNTNNNISLNSFPRDNTKPHQYFSNQNLVRQIVGAFEWIDTITAALYNSEYGCPTSLPSPRTLPKTYQQISLIKRGGNCTFYEKIQKANADGFLGAILYNNVSGDLSSSSYLGDLGPLGGTYSNYNIDTGVNGNITIPAFFVTDIIGQYFLQLLTNYTSSPVANIASTANTTSVTLLRIKMGLSFIANNNASGFPIPSPLSDGNTTQSTQGTFVYVIVSLLVFSLILLAMVVRSRLRRRSRQTGPIIIRQSTNPSSANAEKKVLEPSILAKFPSRAFDSVEDNIESEKPTNKDSGDGDGDKDETRGNPESASAGDTILEIDPDKLDNTKSQQKNYKTCAVCIDDFVQGELIKELPCGHVYHPNCIEQWLTKSSSLCPICKFDCTQANTYQQDQQQQNPSDSDNNDEEDGKV